MSVTTASPLPTAQPALRPRLGGRFGAIDAGAVARAEAALKSLSGQFGQWLNDEVAKLAAARAAVDADGWTAVTAEGLYFRAHDLKGLGGTYEFPSVSRIAASLCKLLDAGRERAPLSLVDEHLNAIGRVVRHGLREAEHPTVQAIASELESRVTEAVAG